MFHTFCEVSCLYSKPSLSKASLYHGSLSTRNIGLFSQHSRIFRNISASSDDLVMLALNVKTSFVSTSLAAQRNTYMGSPLRFIFSLFSSIATHLRYLLSGFGSPPLRAVKAYTPAHRIYLQQP